MGKIKPNTLFKADNAVELHCGLKQCYADAPMGCCNGITNEKNYGYIYIILYNICFMFTKTDSV